MKNNSINRYNTTGNSRCFWREIAWLQGLLEKTTTKSSLSQRNFSMFALTWITEKELERVKKRWRILLKKKTWKFHSGGKKMRNVRGQQGEASRVKMSGSEKKYKRPRTQATKFLVSTYGNSSSSRAKRHCGRAKQWQRTVQKRGAARANLFYC